MVAVARVLNAWRAAERDLGDHPEAGPERKRLLVRIATLRAEYHRLLDLGHVTP